MDVEVATGDDVVGFRALEDLSRCRWWKKRSLSAKTWLEALNLLNGFSDGQMAEVRHVFF
jgi:hypothetical protein